MNLFPEGQESFHVLERRSGRLVSLEAFDTEEAAIEACHPSRKQGAAEAEAAPC